MRITELFWKKKKCLNQFWFSPFSQWLFFSFFFLSFPFLSLPFLFSFSFLFHFPFLFSFSFSIFPLPLPFAFPFQFQVKPIHSLPSSAHPKPRENHSLFSLNTHNSTFLGLSSLSLCQKKEGWHQPKPSQDLHAEHHPSPHFHHDIQQPLLPSLCSWSAISFPPCMTKYISR